MSNKRFYTLTGKIFPVAILVVALLFLMQGKDYVLWGLLAFSFAVDQFSSRTLRRDEEREIVVKRVSADVAQKLVLTVVILMVVTHHLYYELSTTFVLSFLLIIGFLAPPVISLIVNSKRSSQGRSR